MRRNLAVGRSIGDVLKSQKQAPRRQLRPDRAHRAPLPTADFITSGQLATQIHDVEFEQYGGVDVTTFGGASDYYIPNFPSRTIRFTSHEPVSCGPMELDVTIGENRMHGIVRVREVQLSASFEGLMIYQVEADATDVTIERA